MDILGRETHGTRVAVFVGVVLVGMVFAVADARFLSSCGKLIGAIGGAIVMDNPHEPALGLREAYRRITRGCYAAVNDHPSYTSAEVSLAVTAILPRET